jgi:HEPN domain-containing protein
MPGPDPDHWLHRLTAEEWLAAAQTELARCEEALRRRSARTGVTHARRAAGMALNALLVHSPDETWGRSYMDHVRAVAEDGGLPEQVRDAARDLRDTPAAPPELVQLGRPDLHVLESARRIVDWARLRAPPAAAPN